MRVSVDFPNRVKELAKRVDGYKDMLTSEEVVKHSSIMPLFRELGYDVLHPAEFYPSYDLDDDNQMSYAVLRDGKPILLIDYDSTLGKGFVRPRTAVEYCFSAKVSRFVIVTNGVTYHFYSDSDNRGKPDSTPFLSFDLPTITDSQIAFLANFAKGIFNPDSVSDVFLEFKYFNKLKEYFSFEFDHLSDSFTALAMGCFYDKKKTGAAIEKYRGLVKSALEQVIHDRAIEYLKEREGTLGHESQSGVSPTDSPTGLGSTEQSDVDDTKRVDVPMSEEEASATVIVADILRPYLGVSSLTYRSLQSYVSIRLGNTNRKWFCHLDFKGIRGHKSIVFRDHTAAGERVYINDINDIYKLKDKLITALNGVVDDNSIELTDISAEGFTPELV